jgi:hypothetical protein
VFTLTAFTGDYDYLKSTCIDMHGDYDEGRLQNHIESLRTNKLKHGSVAPNFVLLDDLMGLMKHYSPFLQSFITTFRHTNTTIIITAQSLSRGTSTTLRECVDFAFMFNTINQSQINMFFEYWCGMFKNKKIFTEVFTTITSSPHTCLVYEKMKPSIYESYFAFRASSVPLYSFTPINNNNNNNNNNNHNDDDTSDVVRKLF